MCYLCLQDFVFELPVNPNLEEKKNRLLKVKTLIHLGEQMALVESLMIPGERTLCKEKLEALRQEQYRLSREF